MTPIQLTGRVAAMLLFAVTLAVGPPSAAQAQTEAERPLTAEEQATLTKLRGIAESLKPQEGDITLPAAEAVLHLGKDYYFLDAADSRKVIVEAWGNPPAEADGVLGMVFPINGDFVTSWGAVITYEKTGFVPDTDATKADYDEMLKTTWDGEEAQNQARKEAGFGPIHLVGWAQPPQYNAQDHYLIWARDLQFGGGDIHTLNYDVRILSRHGVLSVNIVDAMDHLADVRPAAAALAKTAVFNSGHRYADFNPDTDKKASYGVAGLVAAGLGVAAAKKLGFLAIALLFLKKGAVFILAALAGVGGWFRKLFGGKKRAAKATVKPERFNWDAEPPVAPAEAPLADDGPDRPPQP